MSISALPVISFCIILARANWTSNCCLSLVKLIQWFTNCCATCWCSESKMNKWGNGSKIRLYCATVARDGSLVTIHSPNVLNYKTTKKRVSKTIRRNILTKLAYLWYLWNIEYFECLLAEKQQHTIILVEQVLAFRCKLQLWRRKVMVAKIVSHCCSNLWFLVKDFSRNICFRRAPITA